MDESTSNFDLEGYKTIFSTIRDAVYTLDPNGQITWVNEAAVESFDAGYSRDELIGSSVAKILSPEDINKCTNVILSLVNSEKTSAKCEVTLLGADGEEIPAELHLTLLPSGDGEFQGTLGVAREITDRKKREQRMSVLNRILRHNLRNELNIIIGYTDQLERDDEFPDTHQDPINIIQEVALDLMDLAEKARFLNEFLESDELATYRVDVVNVVNTVCDQREETHGEIPIQRSLSDGVFVNANDHLRNAIDNLLENSIVHNNSKEPRVCVDVSHSPDENQVEISISDNGPGIPETEVETLSRDVETALHHGSGLGIWLVKWIVTSYSGSLTFSESEMGGTEAVISLPSA